MTANHALHIGDHLIRVTPNTDEDLRAGCDELEVTFIGRRDIRLAFPDDLTHDVGVFRLADPERRDVTVGRVRGRSFYLDLDDPRALRWREQLSLSDELCGTAPRTTRHLMATMDSQSVTSDENGARGHDVDHDGWGMDERMQAGAAQNG